MRLVKVQCLLSFTLFAWLLFGLCFKLHIQARADHIRIENSKGRKTMATQVILVSNNIHHLLWTGNYIFKQFQRDTRARHSRRKNTNGRKAPTCQFRLSRFMTDSQREKYYQFEFSHLRQVASASPLYIHAHIHQQRSSYHSFAVSFTSTTLLLIMIMRILYIKLEFEVNVLK